MEIFIYALGFGITVGVALWLTIKSHDDDDGQWFD